MDVTREVARKRGATVRKGPKRTFSEDLRRAGLSSRLMPSSSISISDDARGFSNKRSIGLREGDCILEVLLGEDEKLRSDSMEMEETERDRSGMLDGGVSR